MYLCLCWADIKINLDVKRPRAMAASSSSEYWHPKRNQVQDRLETLVPQARQGWVCDRKGTLGLWGEGNCSFSRGALLTFHAGVPGRSFMQIQPTTGQQTWQDAKSERIIHLSWLLRWSSNRRYTNWVKNDTFRRVSHAFVSSLTFSDFSIFLLMNLELVHISPNPKENDIPKPLATI